MLCENKIDYLISLNWTQKGSENWFGGNAVAFNFHQSVNCFFLPKCKLHVCPITVDIKLNCHRKTYQNHILRIENLMGCHCSLIPVRFPLCGSHGHFPCVRKKNCDCMKLSLLMKTSSARITICCYSVVTRYPDYRLWRLQSPHEIEELMSLFLKLQENKVSTIKEHRRAQSICLKYCGRLSETRGLV